MSEVVIERVNDHLKYQKYVIALNGVSGEVWALPDHAERAIHDMLSELSILTRPRTIH